MSKASFSEKVSVNINSSTLSAIDLLVDNGYYSNRSDFINQALRESLQRQQGNIDRIADGKYLAIQGNRIWFLGVYVLTKFELEELFAKEKYIPVSGYGVLNIDKDCDEQKLFATVSEINVKGRVICSQTIKKHYGLK